MTRLHGIPVLQVLSSPALRCRQTVVPLAESRGLDIEPVPSLAVDADLHALMALINDPEIPDAMLCTHREAIERLLGQWATAGTAVGGRTPMPVAAVWVVRARTDTGALQVQSLVSARLTAAGNSQQRTPELSLPSPRLHTSDELAAPAQGRLTGSQH